MLVIRLGCFVVLKTEVRVFCVVTLRCSEIIRGRGRHVEASNISRLRRSKFKRSECLAWIIDLLVFEINPRDAASDVDLDPEFSLCVIADLSRIAMQCLLCQPSRGRDRVPFP